MRIKEDIISCRLKPGTLLIEQELAENLGISRTPIREAFNLLQQENLVKMVSQRGVFVTEVTVKLMNEVYELREILEPQIVRLATALIPADILLDFQQKFLNIEESTSSKRVELDGIFHTTIARHCGNSIMLQIMLNLYAQMDRIRTLSCRSRQRWHDANSEHLAIISTMLAGNAEKAAHAMLIHVKSSCQAAL